MPTPRRSRLRRSLSACTAEGTLAEVVGSCCGGAAVTGWALHLGMSTRLVALLGALPVVAHLLQLVGACLTARFGHRRTALVSVALSRQAFLPLAAAPLLPLGIEGQRTLLLVAAGAHHGLGIVCNNAWNAWVGEMVPAGLRGRYFGRRTALCTLVGGACALTVGVVLDRAQRTALAGPMLQALALTASVAGAASVAVMARQHAAPHRPESRPRVLAAVLGPLRDARARRVIGYTVAWNGACGLSAPFFGLYLLRDLGTGYTWLAAQGAGLAAARVVSAGAWGRGVDRVGPRRILVACTAGLALSPAAWVVCHPGRAWPLVAETVVGGVLLGGHAVASIALPLSVAPARDRPFYLGTIAMAGGVAFAVTSAAAGALVDAGRAGAVPLRALLLGSAALRVVALAAALALPRRAAAPARDLQPAAANEAPRRAA